MAARSVCSRLGEMIEGFVRAYQVDQEILDLNAKCLSCFVEKTKGSAAQFAALSSPEKTEYLEPFKSFSVFKKEGAREFFSGLVAGICREENWGEIARSTEKVSPDYRNVVDLVLKCIAYKLDIDEIYDWKPWICGLARNIT